MPFYLCLGDSFLSVCLDEPIFIILSYLLCNINNLKKSGCFKKLYSFCKNENKPSPFGKHVWLSHVLSRCNDQKRESITSLLKLKELDVGLLGMEGINAFQGILA